MAQGRPALDDADLPVPSIRFSTEGWKGSAAFEAWQQRVSGIYDSLPTVGAFWAEAHTWHLGAITASHLSYGERQQARSARKIRSDQVDHYRLTVQLEGRMRIDADGQRIEIAPGGILLTDLARPQGYSLEAGAHLSLFVPRAPLDAALRRPLDLHGVVPQGAVAAMLAGHVRLLIENAGALRRSEAAAVAHSTIQLVAASVAPAAGTLLAARPAIESSLLRAARRHIETRLKDDDLTPASIGALLKVSRSTVYRLFEPFGGIAAYIRERRLQRIHALLAAPSERQHLKTLAETYGFSDASHLSRVFNQHFGHRPSEAALHSAFASRPAAPKRNGVDGAALGDWLRALRGFEA